MLNKRLRPFTLPLLLTAAGLFIRLYRLGASSLQIDNFLFWDLFHRDVSFAQILSQWMDLTGLTGQLPLAAAAAKWFLDIAHLPLTFSTLILPFALCGTLAIPVAYMAGREFGGRRMALLLCAMTAFSPLAVQMSREAYFYSPTFLGSFLALWAAGLSGRILKGQAAPRCFHAINAAAFLLMTWSSPSTWPWAFFFVLFNLSLFGWQAFRQRKMGADLPIVLATYAAIGLPLLIAPWGLPQIREFTSDGATRDYWTKVFASGRGASQWAKVWPVLRAYAWGATPLRQIFSALVLILGIIAYMAGFRKNRSFSILGIFFALVLTLNIMALQKSVWVFGITRIVPLAPFYLLFLSAGLLWPFEHLRGKRFAAIALLPLVIAFVLWTEPLMLIPAVTGNNKPFKAAADWADANLPVGTPVVTERYFTAYNEFRVHAPTNVQFVSTVPNQIPEQYNGFGFRQRTLEFFQNNLPAAFYQEKHLWERPDVGPWTDIEKQFARRHSITNRAGLRLAQLGLCYRGDTTRPVPSNGFVCTILYNLPEDIIERARTAGQEAVVLFSKGWKTVSTRDYRLWRVFDHQADITVWNLTEASLDGMLHISGAAAQRPKTVSVNGKAGIFPSGRLTARSIPLTLQPGENRIQLTSPSDDPLLVQKLHWNR